MRAVYLLCLAVLVSKACAEMSELCRIFTGLPNMQSSLGMPGGRALSIRHNLPGRIVFTDTVAEFQILVNLSAVVGTNASDIQINYKMDKDNHSLILEVFKPDSPEPNPPKDQLVLIIATTVSSFIVLCILVTMAIYCCWWKKRAQSVCIHDDENDSQDGLSNTNIELPKPSRKYRIFETGTNPSLHVTIVVVIATICSVHAQLRARVDVIVKVPPGFLGPDIKIFVNEDNNNAIGAANYTNFSSIAVYDVDSASAVQEDRCISPNKTCVHGVCDPLTGDCVCPRGRKPVESSQWLTVCIYKCSQSCPSGSYQESSCNSTHEAVCKKCRSPCSFQEFESTACAGDTDRNCTDIDQLPEINVSPHVIYEDLSKVKSDVIASQLVTNPFSQYTVWLNRSSGIALKVVIKRADFTTKFRQVMHTYTDNMNHPSKENLNTIARNYCKSPLPDYYKINLKKFQDLDVLKTDLSKPCPNYSSTGSFKPKRVGLYCTSVNNTIVGLFGARNSSNIFWKVEKSRYCFDKKNGCLRCRESCSRNFQKYSNCKLTKQDVKFNKQKYGEHFSFCFDCCFSGCTCPSCECTKYKQDCVRGQLSCAKVTQYQLSLTPIFPSNGDFRCHVEMSRGPEVVIETSLWRFGERVYSVKSMNYNLTKGDSGQSHHDFGHMSVSHPTAVQSMMGKTVLVSGNTNKNEFNVGIYESEPDVTNLIATGQERNEIHVQPRVPFGLNSKTFNQRDCDGNIQLASGFVVVQDKSTHRNIRRFENLTAIIDRHNHEDIYKVFDNSESHRIKFGLSRNRSVLRNIFPKTAIVNDASLIGVLVRNRTFWTLKYSGRLKGCPGAFNVKMFDQDMPGVEVYNYDIAVTNGNCAFQVEFHLPSGGDTSLIDKQFLTKFTDSYSTIDLVLVSPRYKPDFDLPTINNKPDFDRLLHVLLPAIYALGTALVLLLMLLIYGYRTRPKDRIQRDRDSNLHFRHILFVVWLIGMRLIKSFLLTLTVFSIICAAIHHSDLTTLKSYSKFRDQRRKIEQEIRKKMDEHKVFELNRQASLLHTRKKICDEKLRQVDELIDAYYAGMRRRLFDDMQENSILRAAYDRIGAKAQQAKEKFNMTRQNVNRKIEMFTKGMNNILQNMRSKVENNFWLRAAKALYRVLDDIASAFDSGLEPFMSWVGLDITFPTMEVSLDSFDTHFDAFLSRFEKPKVNLNSNFKLPNWKVSLPTTDFSVNINELRIPPLNISRPVSSQRAKELLALDWIVAFMRSGVLAGILFVLDIMWFVFRHSRTYQKAVVLLHGFPVVYDLDDIKNDQRSKKESKNSESVDSTRGNSDLGATRESENKVLDSTRGWEGKSVDSTRGWESRSVDSTRGFEDSNMIFSCGFKENFPSTSSLDDDERDIPSLAAVYNGEVIDNGCISIQDDTVNCSGSVNDDRAVEKEQKFVRRVIRHGTLLLEHLNAAILYVYRILKRLNYELTKTNLVPMVLLGAMGLLLVYVVIVTAKFVLTVDTLDTIGYFDVKMAPILVTRKVVNTRITASAFTINQIQIPYYKNRVNARIAFAKKKAAIFKGFQCSTADLHNKEYCFWVDGKCNGVKSYTDDFLTNLIKLECHVPPVIPQRFTKFDKIIFKSQLKKAINTYVSAARGLILNTFYTFLIIAVIFIVIQLFGAVVFLALRRFDLIRTVKSYALKDELKHNEFPDEGEDSHSPEGQLIKVGRLNVPDAIRQRCGSVRVRPGWHLEYRPEEAQNLQKIKDAEKRKEKEKKDYKK